MYFHTLLVSITKESDFLFETPHNKVHFENQDTKSHDGHTSFNLAIVYVEPKFYSMMGTLIMGQREHTFPKCIGFSKNFD